MSSKDAELALASVGARAAHEIAKCSLEPVLEEPGEGRKAEGEVRSGNTDVS